MSMIHKFDDFVYTLTRKIEKERERVHQALKSKASWTKKDFSPPELEESPIKGNTRISQAVFSSLVSRFDVRKLKSAEGLNFKEGHTTFNDILEFYFSRKWRKPKKKKKSKKKAER